MCIEFILAIIGCSLGVMLPRRWRRLVPILGVVLIALLFLCTWVLHNKASRVKLVRRADDGSENFDDLSARLVKRTAALVRNTSVPAARTPVPVATDPSPKPLGRQYVDLYEPPQSSDNCPIPALTPSKFQTKMGWGIPRVFPECGNRKQLFSVLHEHGASASVSFNPDFCQQGGRVWTFNEMPDSMFRRLTSTMDAEMRQNELKDHFHVEGFNEHQVPSFVARDIAVAVGETSIAHLTEPYIIATCGGQRAELHVRAPRPPQMPLPPAEVNPGAIQNILHIMFDSTSLHAQRRGAKKITDWMQQLNQNDAASASVFPMFHYHAVSCCSPGNQIPVYSGNMNGEGDFFVNSEPHQDSKDWVWNIARRLGFRTFWSLDNCPDKSARDYHAFPSVDSRVVAPMCLAGVLLSHKDLGCVAGKTVDEMVLEGLESFWAHHHDERKFAVVQFITPHEDSEKLLIELDGLVSRYFEHLEHSGVLNNTAVVFWSDHGINFGRYASTHDGEIEKLFPFVNFILPRTFAKTSAMGDYLLKNRNRLTSPYDVYEVTRSLLHAPAAPPRFHHDPSNPPLPLPSQSHIMASFQKPITPADLSRSLVSEHRDCSAANIPVEFCTCLPWVEQPRSSPLKRFVDRALKAHRDIVRPLGGKCHAVELDELVALELQEWPHEYKPKGKESAKRMWAMPNRNMVRVTYRTKGPGVGVFVAVFGFDSSDSFDLSRIDRLDSMGKLCGVSDKVAEHMCICV